MSLGPQTWIHAEEMQRERQSWRSANATVGFVPTMGALHAGHLALVKQARAVCDRVVVSIFVNPIQFGPNEDFAQYPRTLQEDSRLLADIGVDGIYLPNAASMYPDGFQTFVTNQQMAQELCGASRPGHFNGVLTVVLKLLQQVRPQISIFGKKDYQQWRLIERMAKDLDLHVEIRGGEIVREEDGLAMSSRNRYLNTAERNEAALIFSGLQAAKEAFVSGETSSAALQQVFSETVKAARDFRPEYCEIRQRSSLQPFPGPVNDQAVMLVAGRMGQTRLIDNIEFS